MNRFELNSESPKIRKPLLPVVLKAALRYMRDPSAPDEVKVGAAYCPAKRR